MRVLTAITLAVALLGAPASFSAESASGGPLDSAYIKGYSMNLVPSGVTPLYRGPLGNNEEPALRPYKWLYQGLKSVFYHTGDQFVEGNLRTPVAGSVQGLRGLRRGTFALGESVYRGAVFAPAPPHDRYKSLGTLNEAVETDLFTRNASDFLFTWYFFPVLKSVDRNPIEGDTKVALRQQEAKEIRMARNEAAKAREKVNLKETRVESAQRDYIGARADYGTPTTKMGRGNLMKLAR